MSNRPLPVDLENCEGCKADRVWTTTSNLTGKRALLRNGFVYPQPHTCGQPNEIPDPITPRFRYERIDGEHDRVIHPDTGETVGVLDFQQWMKLRGGATITRWSFGGREYSSRRRAAAAAYRAHLSSQTHERTQP